MYSVYLSILGTLTQPKELGIFLSCFIQNTTMI